jgi:hypothetical protein
MSEPKQPKYRRIVWYRIGNDALGPFITFTPNVILLPDDTPPHNLSNDVILEFDQQQYRLAVSSILVSAEQLYRVFVDFATAMGWDIRPEAP